jgi:hypothetical protein
VKYLAVFILFFSCVVNAAPSQSGKVTSILVGHVYQNKLFLGVEGVMANAPPCQVNPTFNFVLDISTESGKAYMSVILAAHAAGREVHLTGYDECTIYAGVTNFRSIHVK